MDRFMDYLVMYLMIVVAALSTGVLYVLFKEVLWGYL